MLSKTRTTIITLVAAGGFATATIAPAVSQADQKAGSTPAVTCSGGGQVGDEITVTVTVKRGGQSGCSKSYTEKCESDGKWHTRRIPAVNPVVATPPVVAAQPVVVNVARPALSAG